MQRGTTTADAMRVLMMDSGRGEEASRSPWADAAARCEKMDEAQRGAALGDLTNVDKAEKKHDDAAVKDEGSRGGVRLHLRHPRG